MKIVIPSQYAMLALDQLGFHQLKFHPLPDASNQFVKPVEKGSYYPRLHAITKEQPNGSETILDIHLDLEKHKNAIQDSHLIRHTINLIKEVIN